MDLQQAVTAAKQRIEELFAAADPRDVRLEGFLYDDHLMVWSLTIGFVVSPDPPSPRPARSYKVVRVSESDKSVLSVRDR
ncbi:MAG: hypothetical protein AB7H90_11990 [Alphaproteobacteria bacterium]